MLSTELEAVRAKVDVRLSSPEERHEQLTAFVRYSIFRIERQLGAADHCAYESMCRVVSCSRARAEWTITGRGRSAGRRRIGWSSLRFGNQSAVASRSRRRTVCALFRARTAKNAATSETTQSTITMMRGPAISVPSIGRAPQHLERALVHPLARAIRDGVGVM
jgi:hypothetical protein